MNSSTPIKGVGLSWRQVFGINLAVAFGVSVIIWSFSRDMSFRDVGAAFVWCCIFTNLIGLPAAFILSRWGLQTERRSFAAGLVIVIAEVLVFTTAGTVLITFLMHWIGVSRPGGYWGNLWMSLRFSVIVGLSVGLGAYLWLRKQQELDGARQEIQRRELAEAQARKLAAEARLSSLESRIHPHFLFNTLNSIASLIPDDPQLAEDTVQRLAALLRFSLDTAHERFVPLELEWKIVRDYLEIESARFGSRLRHSLDLEPQAAAVQVPPLSLQTLVENAVKHAAAARREGAEIRVSARVDGRDVLLRVSDNGPGLDSAVTKPGGGLENLHSRLSVLFGAHARLELNKNPEGGLDALLRIPVENTGSGAS